jgi:hypothetical protein
MGKVGAVVMFSLVAVYALMLTLHWALDRGY